MGIMTASAPRPGGYPGHWVGRFIWDGGEARPFHAYRMFRKTVELAAAPAEAALHITAADRYVLYVNGTYLGHGPARSVGPQWMSYDSHNLTPHLRAGTNTLAVLAYVHGCRNSWSANQRAGLFAQLEWRSADNGDHVLGTDDSWRWCAMEGYSRDVGLINIYIGYVNEVLDGQVDPANWMMPDFDDSGWAPAVPVSSKGPVSQRSCWRLLEPRLTPLLCERAVNAVRIVGAGDVQELPAEAFPASQVPERLAQEPHRPLEFATVTAVETLLTGSTASALLASAGPPSAPDARSAVLILDFGPPVLGRPVLEFEAPAGAVIDVACVHQLTNGRAGTLEQASRVGDRYVARAGRQTWQPYFVRVIRYLQIVVRAAPSGVRFHRIGINAVEYPCARRGAFACSDPVLTTLWEAGVNSAYLHMEDTMTLDVVRERVAYLLCGEIEQVHLAAWAGFGDLAITAQGFRQTTRSQLPDGLLAFFIGSCGLYSLGCKDDPRDPVSGANPTTIPNYSFFYAGAVWRYHLRSARPGFLAEHYPALVRIAEWCERQADESALLYNMADWVWFDWMKNDLRGASTAINALYAQMLADTASVAEALERPRDAAQWRQRAETVRAQLRTAHWNPARGLFADSVADGVQSEVVTELANALTLLYGVADREQTASILRQLRDPASALTRVSPLYFCYVLEGMIEAGAADEAYAYLSRRYAPLMAGDDYPMMPEAWPEQAYSGASASGIHGGSAGVVWTLTEHVLGIRSTAPGFASAVFDPRPGNLTWAKGVVPTPHGNIQVEWRRDSDGRITGSVSGPPGVRIVAARP
jgi:alpha-L-rhamnosidase